MWISLAVVTRCGGSESRYCDLPPPLMPGHRDRERARRPGVAVIAATASSVRRATRITNSDHGRRERGDTDGASEREPRAACRPVARPCRVAGARAQTQRRNDEHEDDGRRRRDIGCHSSVADQGRLRSRRAPAPSAAPTFMAVAPASPAWRGDARRRRRLRRRLLLAPHLHVVVPAASPTSSATRPLIERT